MHLLPYSIFFCASTCVSACSTVCLVFGSFCTSSTALRLASSTSYSQRTFHLLLFSPRVWNIPRWQRLGLHTFFPHLLTSNDHISETEGSADSDEWRQRIKTCVYTTKPWWNKRSPAFKTAQLATAFKSTLLCHSFQKYIACCSFQPATLTCDSPGASMPYTQIKQLWNSFVVRSCEFLATPTSSKFSPVSPLSLGITRRGEGEKKR